MRPALFLAAAALLALPAAAADVPAILTKAQFDAGTAKVDAWARKCLTKHAPKSGTKGGTVVVSMKVAPDGTVAEARTVSGPSINVNECVAAVAEKATFAQTKRGGAFPWIWKY